MMHRKGGMQTLLAVKAHYSLCMKSENQNTHLGSKMEDSMRLYHEAKASHFAGLCHNMGARPAEKAINSDRMNKAKKGRWFTW